MCARAARTAPSSDSHSSEPGAAASVGRVDGSRDFDFWLGAWRVEWDEGGVAKVGWQRVETTCDGLVVFERFTADPVREHEGLSVSLWDARSSSWKQTWVDAAGNYLDFAGGLVDGEMILTCAVDDVEQPFRRMRWHDIEPDAFRWSWEASADGEAWWVLMAQRSARVAPEDGPFAAPLALFPRASVGVP